MPASQSARAEVTVLSKDGRSVHARLGGSELVSLWTDGNRSLGCVSVSFARTWIEKARIPNGLMGDLELTEQARSALLAYLDAPLYSPIGRRQRPSGLAECLSQGSQDMLIS
jgi:hypothetical protein